MDVKLFYVSPFQKKILKKNVLVCFGSGVAIGGRPAPGVIIFGVTPYYDMKPKLHRFVVIPYFFHFVWSSPSSFD